MRQRINQSHGNQQFNRGSAVVYGGWSSNGSPTKLHGMNHPTMGMLGYAWNTWNTLEHLELGPGPGRMTVTMGVDFGNPPRVMINGERY